MFFFLYAPFIKFDLAALPMLLALGFTPGVHEYTAYRRLQFEQGARIHFIFMIIGNRETATLKTYADRVNNVTTTIH